MTIDSAPRRRPWLWLAGLALAAYAIYRVLGTSGESASSAATGGRPAAPPVPVVLATVRQGDVPVTVAALGTVTGFNTVTVRSRVDGELINVAFREGQTVHEGDLLAEIDPRPFQVQLAQAEGQLARDAAQLKVARLSLERNRRLLADGIIAQQEFDQQLATVAQYEGAVQADRALMDEAKLQLTYSRITAPISGRIGLRLVDVGNIVHATDQNGLLVIAQVRPITVLFTVAEDALPAILAKIDGAERLVVEAYDRAGRTKLATGSLFSTDNQIDTTTGTTRLKAVFENQDDALFPNQFVNVRLLLDVKRDAAIAPVAAIQRGPDGTFVYVVRADQTVEVRPVTIGPTTGADAAIESGLAAGDLVVTDGVDKLRGGAAVRVQTPATASGKDPPA